VMARYFHAETGTVNIWILDNEPKLVFKWHLNTRPEIEWSFFPKVDKFVWFLYGRD
jgi:hypothetical protein